MPNTKEVDLTLFTKEQLIILLDLQNELNSIIFGDDHKYDNPAPEYLAKRKGTEKTLLEAVKRGEITTSD